MPDFIIAGQVFDNLWLRIHPTSGRSLMIENIELSQCKYNNSPRHQPIQLKIFFGSIDEPLPFPNDLNSMIHGLSPYVMVSTRWRFDAVFVHQNGRLDEPDEPDGVVTFQALQSVYHLPLYSLDSALKSTVTVCPIPIEAICSTVFPIVVSASCLS